MKKLFVIAGLFLLMAFLSCKKEIVEEVAIYKPTPFSLQVPLHFPIPSVPPENPMTVEGVVLGKKFYYDPILSSNGLTCSSCHLANKSFSKPMFISASGDSISIPPHVNLAWNPDYNWNGSEPKLDRLCIADFGPEFFDTDMNQLVQDLKTHPEYPQMIYKAFGISNAVSYTHLDNTACNLASLNLRKFIDEESLQFNVDSFQHACRLWTVVLEISILMAQFPSQEVAQLTHDYRTLGLGYANLGSLLMISGIPYDSNEARAVSASITAIMTGTAYKTSAEMAGVLGAFNKYAENRNHMLRVIRNHRYAAYYANDAFEDLEVIPNGIDAKYCPDYLLRAACKTWDSALECGCLLYTSRCV